MSPEGWAVLSDAIKILGPAAIAAFVGYKAAIVQMNSKLKELENNHEFEARKHLFNYYKEQKHRLEKDSQRVIGEIGELSGFLAGSTAEREEENGAMLQRIADVVRNESRRLLQEVIIAKKELEKNTLNGTAEYNKLDAYAEEVRSFKHENVLSIIQNNLFTISVIYNHLYYCNHLILEKEGDKIFNKYLK